MRLMMCEYTYTPAPPDKGPVVHGVCNRRRLEYIIEEGSITAKMIEDDAAAQLIAKWDGEIEPGPKKKSAPDVQIPAGTVFTAESKDPPALPVKPPIKPAPVFATPALQTRPDFPAPSQMAPSMPPAGIKK